eukprot:TRINITY_DN3101_c0_g1_i6.p2 TRINITY_DN3101_c0_g1~~TRINITY_DN3101_c0_g1_i6.p2  ORF type:complete len:172 (+),score=12.99 TRINITY_DN3101_c0_g1_i6:801-1316(+)
MDSTSDRFGTLLTNLNGKPEVQTWLITNHLQTSLLSSSWSTCPLSIFLQRTATLSTLAAGIFAYVDTFGARLSEQGLGEDVGDDVSLVPEADVRSWIQRAYGDRTVEVPVQSLYTAFRPVVMSILRRHCRSIRSHTFNSVAKQLSEAGKEVFTVRNNAFRGLERHIFDRWP